ncbi:amidohydrolase family-domain-containing protein [Plectosphaerella plurivora]|uniref:Amidohydrolase family-domain-containing protein n=1 Tax=Plectosphaerella plurivora TaxID=936078 RepID=A0A9P9A9S5_9PEZI|nr:amidohydrolase family-domain-containing protein [Plectosphaerella plurivora]
MTLLSCFCLLLAISFIPARAAPSKHEHVADTVFRNGSIYSLDDRSSKYQAMAIKEGRITFLGKDGCVKSFIGPDTTVFDLEGRMAMPGLIDAHMHVISGGANLLKCSLNYQPLGLDEVLAHIQSCLDADTDKTSSDWLEVVALDWYKLNELTGGVTKKDLDSLKTDRPILAISVDFHSFWVNSAALTASQITTSTPNPPGGVIERLPGSQEPSGVLQDNASGLLSGPSPPTAEDDVASAKAALKLLREQGITSFQDAQAGTSIAETFATVQKDGDLSARGWFDWVIDAPNSTAGAGPLADLVEKNIALWNDPAELGPVPALKWQAVKIFVDGVILYPANTGAVIEPYFLPILSAMLEELIPKHIDAQIHVDGDLAVRVALDSLQNFREKHGDSFNYKIGLAHNELTNPSDWARFAELKADPIMQFQWSQASSVWIPNTLNSLGPVRSQHLEAFGDIAKFGRPIVYGSDWPIDPLDEWLAIKAGVTRSGDPTNPNSPAAAGAPYDGPGLPGVKLTRDQAIRAITIEAARFLRADEHIGSLEVGKLADVVVLERNYFEVPEEEIARQKTLLTMVGGDLVFMADGVDFGNGAVAKFPNNGTLDRRMETKSVGGIQGRSLSQEGVEAVRRLSVRNACVHGPLDVHKH